MKITSAKYKIQELIEKNAPELDGREKDYVIEELAKTYKPKGTKPYTTEEDLNEHCRNNLYSIREDYKKHSIIPSVTINDGFTRTISTANWGNNPYFGISYEPSNISSFQGLYGHIIDGVGNYPIVMNDGNRGTINSILDIIDKHTDEGNTIDHIEIDNTTQDSVLDHQVANSITQPTYAGYMQSIFGIPVIVSENIIPGTIIIATRVEGQPHLIEIEEDLR